MGGGTGHHTTHVYRSSQFLSIPFHLVTASLIGTEVLRRVTPFTGLEAELALLARPSRLAQTDLLTQHVGNTRNAGAVVVAGTAVRTGLKRRRGRGKDAY